MSKIEAAACGAINLVAAGILLQLAGCTNTVSMSAIATVRDASAGCAQRQVTFEREVEHDQIDEEYPLWCGILSSNRRMYCFEGELVPMQMLHDGELTSVPLDHPDLACWADERKQWDMLAPSQHPLRPSPDFTGGDY